MNFEKLKIVSFLLVTLLVSSCNSIKLNNLTNEQDLSKKIEVVDIISEKDKLSHNGKKIGDIVFKENKNPDWNYLKNKMLDFAKLNGANLVEVKTLGWGKKGNVFYLEASLYYVENKDYLLNSENIKKSIYFKENVEDCNQENIVLINKDSYKVKLNGKSKYFKVAKQTDGGYLGNSVQIGIGGVYFIEIEDETLGKLLISEIDK